MSTVSSGARLLQAVDAPLTRSATFLVLAAKPGQDALDTIRSTLAGVDGLAKNVSIRDISASFNCTIGIGSNIWDVLTKLPRPAELHPLPILKGTVHATVSTPGDLLFHIRSNRRDICFEFERQLLGQLGPSVEVVDSTVGFRYFDARDLLGFVDGTANPVGADALDAAVITDDKSRATTAAATTSCRSTCTTSPPGPRSKPKTRNPSSAAPNSTTSSWTTPQRASSARTKR